LTGNQVRWIFANTGPFVPHVPFVVGNIGETLVRTEPQPEKFKVQILSTRKKLFSCGNGMPVRSDVSPADFFKQLLDG
jgi:hypothetical protein